MPKHDIPHPLLKPPPTRGHHRAPPRHGAVVQDVQQAVNSAFELTSDAVSASVAVKMSNSARQTVLQQCLVGGGGGLGVIFYLVFKVVYFHLYLGKMFVGLGVTRGKRNSSESLFLSISGGVEQTRIVG